MDIPDGYLFTNLSLKTCRGAEYHTWFWNDLYHVEIQKIDYNNIMVSKKTIFAPIFSLRKQKNDKSTLWTPLQALENKKDKVFIANGFWVETRNYMNITTMGL